MKFLKHKNGVYFVLTTLLVCLSSQPDLLVAAESASCSPMFSGADSVSSQEKKLESSETLTRDLFETSGVLGFATPDHGSLATLVHLLRFLKSVGTDSKLKFIALEMPSELRPVIEELSVRPMEDSEFLQRVGAFWGELVEGKPPEFHFIYREILPELRRINSQRGDDPLLAIPIDSIEESHFSIQLNNRTEDFRTSISRETKTADNFLKYVWARFKDRKGIILYQQAHILRNLLATGYVLNGANVQKASNMPLGWIDYAINKSAALGERYKVILFDRVSKWNPEGVFAENQKLKNKKSYDFGYSNLEFTSERPFAPSAFLSRYRDGTIRLKETNVRPFDAVIWTH
jgi:hypothetical protein